MRYIIIYVVIPSITVPNCHINVLLKILNQSLPGYESHKTIKIKYEIPEGTQGLNHPNPGAKYVRTIRIAYLPCTQEGWEVFKVRAKPK